MSENIREWTAEQWTAEWNEGLPHWSHFAQAAGSILAEAAPTLPEDLTSITDAQIDAHFIEPLRVRGSYTPNVGDNATIYDWLRGVLEENVAQPEPSDPVTNDVNIDAVAQQIAPAMSAVAGAYIGDQAFDQIMSVLRYQFNNWNRGVYKVPSQHRAVAQFDRRLMREHRWSTASHSVVRGQVAPVIDHLWLLSRGERPVIERAPVSSSVLEMVMDAEEIKYAGSTHYLASSVYRVNRAIGSDEEQPDRETFARRLNDQMLRYFEAAHVNEHLTESVIDQCYDLFKTMYFGTGAMAEPKEGVEDLDSLTNWMLGEHPEAGSLQTDAIRDGLADWFDMVRTEPDRIEGEGLVAAMRRQVKAYGFTRFSGKQPRSLLAATLKVVFDKHRGAGLTDEEWRTRWERRDRAVSYVSGRYGEQNSLCSVLEAACKELGIKPMRKPKHKVRFKGSGVLVEVEVESWYDDQSRLLDSARNSWAGMTDEQKEAAVVKRESVYVNWHDMQLAR